MTTTKKDSPQRTQRAPHGAGVYDRFAESAAVALDKRERRARDAAAGLVPFACKLPDALVKQLNERAATHAGGLNALVAESLERGLAR